MSHNNFDEASSSNFDQNSAAQPDSQSAETGNASSQGRGRGKGKKRWIPMELPPDAIAAPIIPSRPVRRPQRQQATGNARFSGNRQEFQQQRDTQSREAASSSTLSQSTQIPTPRYVPGAELAVSSFVPPHLRDRQAAVSNSTSALDQPPAPSGKKNRRQRGRGKNQAAVGSSKPVKEPTTFLSLPFELRERIMVDSYEMTLKELPDSHPKINNKLLDMSPNAVRNRCRRPPAVTVLRNRVLPAGLNSRQRKGFLWKNPGQWGPIFQAMYTCKQLYDEGRAIRYRHIRIYAWHFDYDAVTNNMSLLMNRLSYQPILDSTREVAVSFAHRQDTITIKNLVEALGKLKSLKHLCLIIKGDNEWAIHERRNGTDADLFLFFDLKLESLAIIWGWTNGNPDDREPDMFYGPNGEEWVSSVAEMRMQDCQDDWMKKTFKNSSWYKAYEPFAENRYDLANPNVLENTDNVAPGKIMKHVYRSCENQLYFAPTEDRKVTAPPVWHEELKNPHNHPDQRK